MDLAIRLFAVALLAAATARAGDIYRWTDQDGRVHYTDQPPPPTAKKAQQIRPTGNAVEVDKLPYATQVAAKKNPVTLYSFDCGEPCMAARAYLAKRGVPHTVKDPNASQEVRDALVRLTGKAQVPVLTVGDSPPLRGFEVGAWQAALDAAGYPRSGLVGSPSDKDKGPPQPAEGKP